MGYSEKEIHDLEEDLANKERIVSDYRKDGLEVPSPLLASIEYKRKLLEIIKRDNGKSKAADEEKSGETKHEERVMDEPTLSEETKEELPFNLDEIVQFVSGEETSTRAPYIKEALSKMEGYAEEEGKALSPTEKLFIKYLLFKADDIIEFDTEDYGKDEIVLLRRGVRYDKTVEHMFELCPRVGEFVKRLYNTDQDRRSLNASTRRIIEDASYVVDKYESKIFVQEDGSKKPKF